jgi:hypothetical protein
MENREIWKDVLGFEGVYKVSSFGRVKTLSRNIRFVNEQGNEFFRISKERIMKERYCKGYKTVLLYKSNRYVNYRMCRLVAITFIPNKDNKPQVNHIDGNKENDFVYNLEWNTAKENMAHAKKYGLLKRKDTFVNKLCKKVICTKTGVVYKSLKEASESINISQSHLSRVIRSKYKNNTTLKLLLCQDVNTIKQNS